MNSLIIDGGMDTRSDEEAFEKSARELFESIDKDGDGFIGANELMNYLTVIGTKPTKEDVIKMIEDADRNRKGCLNFEDFFIMIKKTSSSQVNDEEDLIKDAFVAFGGNPDLTGVVDLSQMTNLIQHEFKLEVNVKKLLEAQDVDKSGTIDYQEFKALLIK